MDYSDKVICNGAGDYVVCRHCAFSHPFTFRKCYVLHCSKGIFQTIPFEFQVGDRAEQIGNVCTNENPIVTVTKISGGCLHHIHDDEPIPELELCSKISDFKFISRGEQKMEKKEELKKRIKAISESSTIKEVDDILLVLRQNTPYGCSAIRRILISTDDAAKISILEGTSSAWNEVIYFTYNDQCGKIEAFKSALLWLLERAEFKDDEKEEKIALIAELEKKTGELKELLIRAKNICES